VNAFGVDVRGLDVEAFLAAARHLFPLLALAFLALVVRLRRPALLLAGIVRRTVKHRQRVGRGLQSSRGSPGMVRPTSSADIDASWLATTAAMLWVVHPLGTQTVTYISQRTELLAACSIVGVVYCLIRYAEFGLLPWAALGWIAFLLGIASKETAAVAPIVAVVYDAVFITGSWRITWRARWRWYAALAVCWIGLAALMARADLAARGVGLDQDMSPAAYALVECRALLTYLRLSVWPSPLVFDYGWAPPVSYLAVVTVVVMVAVSFFAAVRGRVVGWLALLWLVLLAPTSSFVPIAEQPIAENRPYLANAIVVAGLAVLAARWLGRRAVVLAVVVTLGFISLTAVRNGQYRSEGSLWSDTAAKRPTNARAWSALGLLEYKLGHADAAIALHQKAIAARPTYAEAHGNLGADFLLAKRPADAVLEFRRALELEPQLPAGKSNLAQALLADGNARLFAHEISGAIAAYEEALRIDPNFAFAHNNLASALLQAGRFDESLQHANAALQLDPNYVAAHGTAATAALQLGRIDDAVAHFRAALALEPTAPSHTGLGIALARKGDRDAAISELRAALQLKPDYAPALRALEELSR